jgi:tetratricopeptide (TPR) repeat protein
MVVRSVSGDRPVRLRCQDAQVTYRDGQVSGRIPVRIWCPDVGAAAVTGTAAEKFATDLRALYKAAGAPTLQTLVRQAAGQVPPIKLTVSGTSDWINGKAVPRSSAGLRFLVQYLQGLARHDHSRRPDAWWEARRRQAWAEKHTNRGGRPAAVRPGRVQLNAHPAIPPRRSGYWRLIEQLAPSVLDDRLAELAIMEENTDSYLWWQAPAWAGKSALMAWFALNPPPGVRVAAFFVTSQFAGHDNQRGFLEIMTDQLAVLAGGTNSVRPSDAGQLPTFLDLLDLAAHSCRTRGERLTLVVDGLDEDRDAAGGPDAHSIAALLPKYPPAGVRIIVAGRPHPPVPPDVPADHPLRTAAIVRQLEASPLAGVVRTGAERELARLLGGTRLDRDIVGLITVARGGLTLADVAALTDESAWTIEQRLRTVSGRTFLLRPSRWRPDDAPPTYVIGHKALQADALAALSPRAIDGFRQRLRSWAEAHAAKGWPEDTPEYLATSYFELLRDTDDTSRQMSLAVDPGRRNWLAELTGSDSHVLAELHDLLDAVTESSDPDLLAMLRLAEYRDRLTAGTTNMPSHLPRLFSALGLTARGISLARSLDKPSTRALALIGVASAIPGQRPDLFQSLIDDATDTADLEPEIAEYVVAAAANAARPVDAALAGQLADRLNSPFVIAKFQAGEVKTLAAAGEFDSAMVLARQIGSAELASTASAVIATALVAVGRAAEALELVPQIEKSWYPDRSLTSLGVALIGGGYPDEARTIATRMQQSIPRRSIVEHDGGVLAWAGAAQLLGMLGHRDQVETMLRHPPPGNRSAHPPQFVPRILAALGDFARALDAAQAIKIGEYRDNALADLSTIAGRARHYADAERYADLISVVDKRAAALTNLGYVLLNHARPDEALRIARHAEVTARTVASDHTRHVAMMAEALADTGHHSEAELLLSRIQPEQRRWQTGTIAQSMAAAGQVQRALRLLDVLPDEDDTYAEIVKTVASNHDWASAKSIADRITDTSVRQRAMTSILIAQAAAGQIEFSERLIDEIRGSHQDEQTLVTVVTAAATAGQLTRALAIAEGINDTTNRIEAMGSIATVMVAQGQLDQAINILQTRPRDNFLFTLAIVWADLVAAIAKKGDLVRARELAQGIADHDYRSRAVASICAAFADWGDLEVAQAMAVDIDHLYQQGRAFAAVARAAAQRGQLDWAEELAQALRHPEHQADAFESVVIAALTTDWKRAEAIALRIKDPSQAVQAFRACAAQVDQPLTRRFIGRMLRFYQWHSAIDIIAQKAPSILMAFADDLG